MVKRINVANGTLEVSEISLGCMRIADLSPKEAEVHIHSSLEVGIDFFDHADIYAGGKAEEVFGNVLAANPGMRDRLREAQRALAELEEPATVGSQLTEGPDQRRRIAGRIGETGTMAIDERGEFAGKRVDEREPCRRVVARLVGQRHE